MHQRATDDADAENIEPPLREIEYVRVEQPADDILRHDRMPNIVERPRS